MARRVLACSRCGCRFRGGREWNAILENGVVKGLLCPACQTPEQNAEAVINEATLVYGQRADGRIVGRPAGGDV